MEHDLSTLKAALEKYETVRGVFLECFDFVIDVQNTVKSTPLSLERMTDLAYVCKESAKLLDDLRKEYTRLGETLEKLTCAIWIRETDIGENTQPNIKGVLATGTPDMKMAARVPREKDEPEKYHALLKHLGFNDITITNSLASLHWPKLTEYVTALTEEGKPLPPGFDPTDSYPVYRLRLTAYLQPDAFYRQVKELLAELKRAHDAKQQEQTEQIWETRLTVRRAKQ